MNRAPFLRFVFASFASRAFFGTRTSLPSSTRKRAIAWSASESYRGLLSISLPYLGAGFKPVSRASLAP